MFEFLTNRKDRTKKILEDLPAGPLKQYLSTPQADHKIDIHDVPLLVLDFETSGLNAAEDEILSIGYVAIDGGEIKLATASHQVIKSSQALSEENVAIHRITDDESAAGNLRADAIQQLLVAMTGRVMVAHNANIETAFLAQACLGMYGVSPDFPAIDTMLIAKRWMERRNKQIGRGDLRLFNLSKRYQLPVYQAHNALNDAIATAELLQAQIAHMDSKQALPLKQFLR